MDRRYELARDQAEENFGGKVVFAKSAAQLKVLVEHGAKSQGYGL